jgi:hypothetical protein
MSLETDLWTLLMSAPAVAALAETRLYPLMIPQDQDLPALAYQLISAPGIYSHETGDIGLIRARMQITGQAATYDTLYSLLAAVRAAVTGYKGTVGDTDFHAIFVDNQRTEWAETFLRPTGRLDLVLWYREVV